MNFVLTLTTILLLGSGAASISKPNIFLNQSQNVSMPSFQRFTVRCTVYPSSKTYKNLLQWISPDGHPIPENVKESPVMVMRSSVAKTLVFKNPMPRDSGRYACAFAGNGNAKNKTIQIHFQEDTKCPQDTFMSSNGCQRCPRNSRTLYIGAVSPRDCFCKQGYQGSPGKGIPCSDINECLDGNFGCSHECKNTPGGAHCACPTGYRLRHYDMKTCEDVDECSSEELNKCTQNCNNKDGGYECSCVPGYVLVDKYRCEGCRRNAYRTSNDEFCTDCPANSATDGPGKRSIEDCKCFPGFTGDPALGIPCVDINECQENNFGCSDECINTPGSAHCSCPKGYELDVDSKNCRDVDECAANNGGCDGRCENTEGSFRCICDAGYEIKDFYSCQDIDECSVLNGGCSHICTNFRGGRYCSCRQGFKLAADQKSCVANRCQRVPEPPHSTLSCYKNPIPRKISSNTAVALQISESYENGTTCYMECDSGYKSNYMLNYMQCMEDGRWDKELPSCIAKQCGRLAIPQHGAINPRSCGRSTAAGRRCIFTCNRGYKLKGTAMLKCGNNQQWLRKKTFQLPVCQPIKITPHITCSDDITAVLEAGYNITSIIVPGPQTASDVRVIEVFPDWVRVDTGTVFSAGVTEITFTARSSSDANLTASCLVTVNVVDDEPPLAQFCPQSFAVESNSSEGATVHWPEPVFTDNVGVQSITSNTRHGDTFLPGVYLIRYSALDRAGNEGTCEFVVNVTSPECGYPKDPANGRVNCNDWTYGRLCSVECDAQYSLYPPEPSIFSCDDSGVWEPTNVVQDCMPTLPALNSSCPDGYELLIRPDDETCVECPIDWPWSEEDGTCKSSQSEYVS